jgi:hypothetical protein
MGGIHKGFRISCCVQRRTERLVRGADDIEYDFALANNFGKGCRISGCVEKITVITVEDFMSSFVCVVAVCKEDRIPDIGEKLRSLSKPKLLRISVSPRAQYVTSFPYSSSFKSWCGFYDARLLQGVVLKVNGRPCNDKYGTVAMQVATNSALER